MKSLFFVMAVACLLLMGCGTTPESKRLPKESPPKEASRMDWWREARFGLFIHWGLYAIPAGEWEGNTNHAEWIMHTAKIPVEVYEKFLETFNPVQFNADQWVRMAKEAGMKYVVITSKHHDGFCLFDSAHTDYDVMSTPFQRDIMQELSQACRREGIKICWYHSIMDWHHPDYLPRRPWEKRSAQGADYARYVEHMKKQLQELTQNYGEIGVLWFDGEWEGTWTHGHGKSLYDYVRGLEPNIIINNRVDTGRGGMAGMSESGKYAGDFGTPEQQIPATGLPGVDWETCMTMNNHWGFNKHDQNWKSAEDLIRKLADIASKGGNFLLNVGPTAEGLFPEPCVERLKAMGQWMEANGDAIYGTRASPFESLAWGRCTQKALAGGGTRLFLHVFHWPQNSTLLVPGLDNEVRGARLLGDPSAEALEVERRGVDLAVSVPAEAPDSINTVVVLDIEGLPAVIAPPEIHADSFLFIDHLEVSLFTLVEKVSIRYTLDGTEPGLESALYEEPITLNETCILKAALFRNSAALSRAGEASFQKVEPLKGVKPPIATRGLRYEYYEGRWEKLPDFDALVPNEKGITSTITLDLPRREECYGFRFFGLIRIEKEGKYTFYLDSDDGSRLHVHQTLVVDNDGLHSGREVSGEIALGAGLHPITLAFFECTGDQILELSYEGPGLAKQVVPAEALLH